MIELIFVVSFFTLGWLLNMIWKDLK